MLILHLSAVESQNRLAASISLPQPQVALDRSGSGSLSKESRICSAKIVIVLSQQFLESLW